MHAVVIPGECCLEVQYKEAIELATNAQRYNTLFPSINFKPNSECFPIIRVTVRNDCSHLPLGITLTTLWCGPLLLSSGSQPDWLWQKFPTMTFSLLHTPVAS